MGSVLHLQGYVVYETVLDSIRLWLLEIWVLWDMIVSGEWFSSFQRIIVLSSSFIKAFLGCLILSDEGTMILQKFRNPSLSDTESHPRRLDPQQHCCKNLKSYPLLLIQDVKLKSGPILIRVIYLLRFTCYVHVILHNEPLFTVSVGNNVHSFQCTYRHVSPCSSQLFLVFFHLLLRWHE